MNDHDGMTCRISCVYQPATPAGAPKCCLPGLPDSEPISAQARCADLDRIQNDQPGDDHLLNIRQERADPARLIDNEDPRREFVPQAIIRMCVPESCLLSASLSPSSGALSVGFAV